MSERCILLPPRVEVASRAVNLKGAFDFFVDRLRQHGGLGRAEVEALSRLPSYVSHAKRHGEITGEGQADSVHLVAEGVVGRSTVLREGERQVTAIYLAGDVCDLHSLVAPPSASTLEALSSATVLRIAHADLWEVARRFPAVAEALWRQCAVEAAVLETWVVNVGRRDARSRFAHLLCELSLRLENGRSGSRTEFRLDVTQCQLADALGLTPVHTNRTLQALRQNGLIETTGKIVRINDWPALAQLAGFDAAYLQLEKSDHPEVVRRA
jgi:CRP-like cAMP-binding protein